MAIVLQVKPMYGYGAAVSDGSRPFSFVAAASNNLAPIKLGAGVITMIHAINVNAAVRYLKFYDSYTQPTVGTTVPTRRFGVPGATTGAGFNVPIIAPLVFDKGIWVAMVTGIADSDNTSTSANDAVVDIEFV